MSLSLVVHDTVSLDRNQKRSCLLTYPRRPGSIPVPPTLVNSPYLFSPNVFWRKSSVLRWPSQEEDEWLRDMVPIDRPASDTDTKSEASGTSTPSPTSSDNPFASLTILPPSPMSRPRSTSPDALTPTKRPLYGLGSGQTSHS